MSKEGKRGRSNCATATALEIVGDRWSLLIVRDFIFRGRREFGDFMELQEGISTNILTSRLEWLTEEGILSKHPHPTNKKKYYYEITEKGFDLVLVIMDLAQWGWKHLSGACSPRAVKRLFKRDRDEFVKVWREEVNKRSKEYLREARRD